MPRVSRRRFLDLASAVTTLTLAGCFDDSDDGSGDPNPADPDGSSGSGGAGTGGAGGAGSGGSGPIGPPKSGLPVGIAGYEDPALRAAAVVKAIELAGGFPWLKSGDTVLVKVAMNSPNPYPATSSPVACAELVKLLLAAGAGKVVIADLMGLENTLMPGGWALEDPFGGGFNAQTDGTIRAFQHSGLWGAVESAVGAANIGPNAKVHMTSFREHGWYRYESAGDTVDGAARLVSTWVQDQMEKAERWDGKPFKLKYKKRAFDALVEDVPGMYVPNLVADVDHIVNLHRISTHVMSHFTLALKNWVGIMRPDDRIWMHQIGYLLNHRGTGDDPIRTEPPYNELLAELHLSTASRERLVLADASEVIASGGPDSSDKDLFPAQLIVAAGDLVSADVVGLSIIRQAVMASTLQGGLGGQCSPPPQSAGELSVGFLFDQLSVPWHEGLLYGNDVKLCDPNFSHWDWVAVQRARELELGCASPDDLNLQFAPAGPHELPPEQQTWIETDATVPPVS